MNNELFFSSKSNEWRTPPEIFEKLNEEFDFTVDVAASPENALCNKYYTIDDNGLEKDWTGERVFCNPPYGREISKWVKKAYSEWEKRY